MSNLEYTYTVPELPNVTVSLEFSHFSDRAQYRYRLEESGKVIFEGDSFGPAPHVDPYSRDSVMHLLTFLTLRKGDTDNEYFDNYTPAQLDWIESDTCEELRWIVYDYEENGRG